ncbi:hypothetical protein ACSDQ9_01470 [Aestuariimicrobium soli]|uniref:hypothetical protein n=1 Tax=Aestuariimicrobium soli TaxID=2035834 RepID=UPI003EB6BFB4
MPEVSAADPDRDAVYLAEHRLEAALELLPSGGEVTAFGRVLRLEQAQEFTTLAAAQGFATLTCIELGEPPVTVAHARGQTRSSYVPGSTDNESPATIRLAHWGGTRVTLCHELAHHLTRGSTPAHGAPFRAALLRLLVHCGAPGQAEWLRLAWAEAGLSLVGSTVP